MVSQLDDFCELIRSNYGSPEAISPGDLAGVFVSHSGLSSSPSFMELHSVLQRYDVSEITAADLTAGKMKGHHFSYKEQAYTVMYEKDLWTGSIEHVMLHELYEIISERSEKWCPGYRALPVPQICSKANSFAAAALMQPGIFLQALFDSGLDAVQLHHRFGRAYSSVAIRAVDVLNTQNKELSLAEQIDLMIAIYERREQGEPNEWGFCTPEKFEVKYFVRTKGIKLGTKGGNWLQGGRVRGPNYRAPRYPYHLIPKLGDAVPSKSVVHDVIGTVKCHYVERVTGFDFWGLNDLTFTAQPVKWYGNLAKVVLVGVRHKNSRLLDAQLNSLHPIRIQQSYQVI
jgi:hypothetical protein